MYKIALFPLSTVLFPGMPIQLHIFETRYRMMIQRCLKENLPFGVVLIHQGVEAYGPPAEPVKVGCAARIFNTTILEDGRINLTAMGDERFRIIKLDYDLPYLMGEVESLPLEHSHSIEMMRGVRQLTGLIRIYLQMVGQLDPTQPFKPEEIQFPEDPLMMLSLAAALLQVPTTEKQPLLEITHACELLNELLRLYRRDTILLRKHSLIGERAFQKMADLN
jgi:Lon protease-like protein